MTLKLLGLLLPHMRLPPTFLVHCSLFQRARIHLLERIYTASLWGLGGVGNIMIEYWFLFSFTSHECSLSLIPFSIPLAPRLGSLSCFLPLRYLIHLSQCSTPWSSEAQLCPQPAQRPSTARQGSSCSS
ncbi:hypothetical protein B0H19DRAFT_1146352 [Mycena capillaripes]|nr:hypothetical protein B0H19DRAFT_1146352 [Mycena capillaripes]